MESLFETLKNMPEEERVYREAKTLLQTLGEDIRTCIIDFCENYDGIAWLERGMPDESVYDDDSKQTYDYLLGLTSALVRCMTIREEHMRKDVPHD